MSFISTRNIFHSKNDAFKDMVQGHMAMDIEMHLKTDSGMPVKTGAMKSGTRHFRSSNGGFRVEIDKGYAAFQERGMRRDGTHIVRHYSTGGTSKGFFRRAINMVINHKISYIQEARRALNL